MYEINVTELRSHLHKYLDRVQKGTEVSVTWHGKVIARILPPINRKNEASNQLKALRSHSKITDVISPIDNYPGLVLTKLKFKSLKDLSDTVSVKVHEDINESVLPGYDEWSF